MARLLAIRLWVTVGILVLGFAMPYFSAALGWAATQDDSSITVRADVAAGVLVGVVGLAILLLALCASAIARFRTPRPTSVFSDASGGDRIARVPSR